MTSSSNGGQIRKTNNRGPVKLLMCIWAQARMTAPLAVVTVARPRL